MEAVIDRAQAPAAGGTARLRLLALAVAGMAAITTLLNPPLFFVFFFRAEDPHSVDHPFGSPPHVIIPFLLVMGALGLYASSGAGSAVADEGVAPAGPRGLAHHSPYALTLLLTLLSTFALTRTFSHQSSRESLYSLWLGYDGPPAWNIAPLFAAGVYLLGAAAWMRLTDVNAGRARSQPTAMHRVWLAARGLTIFSVGGVALALFLYGWGSNTRLPLGNSGIGYSALLLVKLAIVVLLVVAMQAALARLPDAWRTRFGWLVLVPLAVISILVAARVGQVLAS